MAPNSVVEGSYNLMSYQFKNVILTKIRLTTEGTKVCAKGYIVLMVGGTPHRRTVLARDVDVNCVPLPIFW